MKQVNEYEKNYIHINDVIIPDFVGRYIIVG